VAVDAGRIESEFVALDVVRWSQIMVPLDGVERLEALNECFHAALRPVLRDATDRLHAIRVSLTGSTELHRLEANRPGTLNAAIRAAAQDVSEAEIWVEQVRLDLSTPLDRGRAAGRQDAVGEIIRLVDTIAGDDAKMKRWLEAELGELLNAMPPEVTAGEVPSWDDLGELRGLLMDAEATVLARLAPAGGDG
jgi:exonuclease SbcD